MYLMLLSQGDIEIPYALFNSLASGQQFAATIPGYRRIVDDSAGFEAEYEIIQADGLPEYTELSHQGSRIPLSRLMFAGTEDIDIFWQEIPSLEQGIEGLVSGSTRVDAYLIPNNEVADYIAKRETAYRRIHDILQTQGYRVWREYAGSEDGEAIHCQKEGSDNQHCIAYMDPQFIDDTQLDDAALTAWVQAQMAQHG